MRIMVLGSDGFSGYPLCQNLLNRDHTVFGVDNFLRRELVEKEGSQSVIPIASPKKREEALKDLGNFYFREIDIAEEYDKLEETIVDFEPDAIVNLAQIPSAPFSQKDRDSAELTISNNVIGFLNLLWVLKNTENKDVPIVFLASMGTYGQSVNGPIPEGFFQPTWGEGFQDVLPFPRSGGSLYHVSKIQLDDLAWYATRIWEMQITAIEQGIIFGAHAPSKKSGVYRSRLDVDSKFGTVINRFVSCAAKGVPLPIYGSGLQERAMLPLRDSVRCTTLLAENPPSDEDSMHYLRVVNQFTNSYSIEKVASMVREVGEEKFCLDVEFKYLENPRVEEEVHYFDPETNKLENLGFEPSTTLYEEIELTLEEALKHTDRIDEKIIHPEVTWR